MGTRLMGVCTIEGPPCQGRNCTRLEEQPSHRSFQCVLYISIMKRRMCLLLLASLLPCSAQAPKKGSPTGPTPQQIADQMVSSLPWVIARDYNVKSTGPDSVGAYSDGVGDMINKGLFQATHFGFVVAQLPDEGLGQWFKDWGVEARRLGADFPGNGSLVLEIAMKGLPKLYQGGKPNMEMAQMYLGRPESDVSTVN